MRAYHTEELSFAFGRYAGMLNPDLVARQNLIPDAVRKLRESHVEKLELFERLRATPVPDEMLAVAREIDALEYRQQSLWGFPLDPKFHYWFAVPRCTCCKVWNGEFYGVSPFRLISTDCPLHAQLVRPITPKGNIETVALSSIQSGVMDTLPALTPAAGAYWLIDTTDPVDGAPLLHFVRPEPLPADH